MSLTVFASLIITYAVVQTIVFLLLIRLLDPYEREPLSLLALMTLWGAVGATSLSAAGNVALRNWLPDDIAAVFGQAIYAPVVEELAKGVALVAFVVLSLWAAGRFGMPRFEGVTDGIVYGAAIGLGFAFTEDVLFLLIGASEQGLEQGFVTYLSRRYFFFFVMVNNEIYTATFGVGLG
ncbi:MAG: PrsW family intramembrane metalloprotease, partial [Actinomycetota bacterium]|nr:PrsW family intramembrane metalloprotease [Actinomycetota bacterium]